MTAPAPSFAHIRRLTDDTGLFEHAEYARLRRQHGYCTDDIARGLVVTCREPDPPAEVMRLAECYLTFLTNAQDITGAFHNRLSLDPMNIFRRPADCCGSNTQPPPVGCVRAPVSGSARMPPRRRRYDR